LLRDGETDFETYADVWLWVVCFCCRMKFVNSSQTQCVDQGLFRARKRSSLPHVIPHSSRKLQHAPSEMKPLKNSKTGQSVDTAQPSRRSPFICIIQSHRAMVSVSAFGPEVSGFNPGRGDIFLRVIKSEASLPSERGGGR
jgi:hypothetical protein